jgi:hypothetical protein
MLSMLMTADIGNRGPIIQYAYDLYAAGMAENVLDKKPDPILMGRHLIVDGSPYSGPTMGKILKEAYQAQLDGTITNLDDALDFARNWVPF